MMWLLLLRNQSAQLRITPSLLSATKMVEMIKDELIRQRLAQDCTYFDPDPDHYQYNCIIHC
jgi:hypothetical protein